MTERPEELHVTLELRDGTLLEVTARFAGIDRSDGLATYLAYMDIDATQVASMHADVLPARSKLGVATPYTPPTPRRPWWSRRWIGALLLTWTGIGFVLGVTAMFWAPNLLIGWFLAAVLGVSAGWALAFGRRLVR